MNHTSSHWSNWIQTAQDNPLHAWSNGLRLGTFEEVKTLPERFPLNAQEQQNLLHSLLSDRLLDVRALDRLMSLTPWPQEWLGQWLANRSERAMAGGRLEEVLDWWMSIPLEPVEEHVRYAVLAHARRTQLQTLIEARGKGETQWEVLARLDAYDGSWGPQHGASGCWAGVVLEFTPQGQQIDSTRHWSEDALCLGLRVAMNQAHCRNLIWGTVEQLPTAAWQKWERWLGDSPNRQAAWDRIVREDVQDVQLARDWTQAMFPDNCWEGNTLLRQSKDGIYRMNVGQFLDHPYWGECAAGLTITEEERLALVKGLLDTRQSGERAIALVHRTVAAWLAGLAEQRASEGDRRLFEAYSHSPAGRRLPCPPTLMSLGASSNGPWIKTLAMKSSTGTDQLLDTLRDERVVLAFKLTPEDLIQWLAGPQGAQVRAWRDDRGDHLLSVALPRRWRESSKPPLSPNLAKGFLELVPEWLVEPTSEGGCLLDFNLTETKAQAYIRQQALGRVAQQSDGRACEPNRRM